MLSSSIESFFGSFSLFSDDWRLEEATKTVLLAVVCGRSPEYSSAVQRSADMVVALPGLVRSNPWEPRPDDWDTVYWEEEGQHQETGAGSKIWNRGEGEGV